MFSDVGGGVSDVGCLELQCFGLSASSADGGDIVFHCFSSR